MFITKELALLAEFLQYAYGRLYNEKMTINKYNHDSMKSRSSMYIMFNIIDGNSYIIISVLDIKNIGMYMRYNQYRSVVETMLNTSNIRFTFNQAWAKENQDFILSLSKDIHNMNDEEFELYIKLRYGI